MPVYYFNLRQGTELAHDSEGTHFADETTAREHARIVAGELMRNVETDRRSWRLEVCDDERRPCFHMLFVEVDPLLAELPLEIQRSVIDGWTRTASLQDTIRDVQLSLLQVKATLARSNGKPYVAALEGARV